jgi:hypothetical protein
MAGEARVRIWQVVAVFGWVLAAWGWTRGSGDSTVQPGESSPVLAPRPVAPSKPAEQAVHRPEAVDAADRVDPVVPPELLAAAVDAELRRRAEREVLAARKRLVDERFEGIGEVVDALVEERVLPESAAGEIEFLLQAELEAGWQIKLDVTSGALDQEGAMIAWKDLVAAFDAELLALVPEPAVHRLRKELDGK